MLRCHFNLGNATRSLAMSLPMTSVQPRHHPSIAVVPMSPAHRGRTCESRGTWQMVREPRPYAARTTPRPRRRRRGRAADAYRRAASAQRAAFHVDAALRLANRGLEIAQADADRHALICLKGELQRDLGDIASSVTTYRLAIEDALDEREDAPRESAEAVRHHRGLGYSPDAVIRFCSGTSSRWQDAEPRRAAARDG